MDLGWVVAAYRNWRFSVRQFRLGDARQLDTVPVELLARAWTAAAGSGDEALTIDVDSPIYETYRLAKQGGTKFTCKHVRSYHPLYAVAARTGDIVTADCSAAMPTPGGERRPFSPGTSTGCEPAARPERSCTELILASTITRCGALRQGRSPFLHHTPPCP